MSHSIFEPDPDFDRRPGDRRVERSRLPMFLLGGLGCLFVLGLVAVPAAILFLARGAIQEAWHAQQPAPIPPAESETPEQRQADVQAGFGVPAPQVDAETLASLTKFFDTVIEATKNDDSRAFRKTIDGRRFMQEVKKTGLIRSLSNADDEYYVKDFQNRWLSLPARWTKHRIVNVKLLAGGKDALAYVWFWNEGDVVDSVRYWVTRSGDGWKGYDWDDIQYGTRESFDAAVICCKYAGDPRNDEHHQTLVDVSKSGESPAEGDQAAGVDLLERAEKRVRLPELADQQLVMLAYAWNRLGRPRDTMRCARQVKSPLATPGAFYVQALVYQQWQFHRRALEFAKKYDSAVGGDPTSWQLLATIYDRLDDPRTAAEYWRKVVQYEPESTIALDKLVASFDEDDQAFFFDALRKTSEPADVAAGIVERLAYSTEPGTLRALCQFVSDREPDSARAAFLQGIVAQADERHDEAAGFFKLAFQREIDDEVREEYVNRFLDAMSAAEKVVTGYEQAPERDAAFEYLMIGIDDDEPGLTRENRRALIDAHRPHSPDAPPLHYQAGLLLDEDDDFDGARHEFNAAIEASGDTDESTRYRQALVGLLHRKGRDVEAYQTVPPVNDTFQQLVTLHRWGDDSEPLDLLKEVYRLHLSANPTDGWLDFCAVIIHRREKNTAEALRLALHGFDHAGDEALKAQYRWLVIDLTVAEGDFATVYRVVAGPDDALSQLGNRFSSVAERDKLKSLLEWHVANNFKKSPVWRFLSVQHSWNAEDYSGVLERIALLPKSAALERSLWQSRNLDEWHIRSLLKLGRLDEAERTAKALFEDDGKALPLLLVYLARKNATAVGELLEEREFMSYELDNLYHDPETGSVLSSPEFLPVRRKFPPTLPYSGGSSEAVLLLKNPTALTAESVKAITESVLGAEFSVEAIGIDPRRSAPRITEQWLLQSGPTRLIVSSGSERYDDPVGNRSTKLKDTALQQVLADHRGWIAIEEVALPYGSPGGRRVMSQEFCRLAARLLENDGLALYLSHGSRLIENSAELRSALGADNAQEATAKMGVAHWLSRASAESAVGNRKRDREFQKSLRRMLEAFKTRQPDQTFEVVAIVRSSSAAELLHFDVVSTKSAGYGGQRLVGILKQPSKLLPRLAVGDPLNIPQSCVVEWSYNHNDKVERARRSE